MEGRERPHPGRQGSANRNLIDLRLELPLATKLSAADPAEPRSDQRSLQTRRLSAAPVIGGAAIAFLLGWTIYYDLLSHRPDRALSTVRPPRAIAFATVPFPQNGTVTANFQRSEVAGGGLQLQTPASDPSRLFLAAIEDWQTGRLVARVYLLANTIATVPLPPGRYRLLFASGRTWLGEEHMFGPGMRVDETLTPFRLDGAQAKPVAVGWDGSPSDYLTAEVPASLLSLLVAKEGR